MEKEKQHTACGECGARLPEGAEACDLCGLPVTPEAEGPGLSPEAEELEEGPVPEAAPGEPGGPYCNQCGWRNPPGARFCSRCGTPLQELAGAPAAGPAPARPPEVGIAAPRPEPGDRSGVGQQVALLIGAGLLLVIALYLVTVFSRDLPRGAALPSTQEEAASAPVPPAGVLLGEQQELPPQIAEQAAGLEREIEGLEGEEALERRRALVNLFVGAGRVDRAAVEQERIARVEDTAESWTRAGNLYYDWMEAAQGAQKTDVARRAIAAYQRVLEKEPDNLDVRTDMAVAYQYDPANAMEAITQTNRVLEADPDHVQANFNKGIFLLQINRLDQATAQFERVKELVEAGSPVYNRAEEVIQYIGEIQSQQ